MFLWIYNVAYVPPIAVNISAGFKCMDILLKYDERSLPWQHLSMATIYREIVHLMKLL